MTTRSHYFQKCHYKKIGDHRWMEGIAKVPAFDHFNVEPEFVVTLDGEKINGSGIAKLRLTEASHFGATGICLDGEDLREKIFGIEDISTEVKAYLTEIYNTNRPHSMILIIQKLRETYKDLGLMQAKIMAETLFPFKK